LCEAENFNITMSGGSDSNRPYVRTWHVKCVNHLKIVSVYTDVIVTTMK